MIDVRRLVASNRPHQRVGARASRVGEHIHVQLRRVWPDQSGPFLAALTDTLADLPVVWVDARLLDGVLVVAVDRDGAPERHREADGDDAGAAVDQAVVAAVEAAELRAGIECNPFPEHRHGAPVEDEPLLRAAAEVVADVFSFGMSVTLRALRAPRLPVEVDFAGVVALVQNVPGLRRTLARWVGRATAEAGAGVAAALASALAQNVAGRVVATVGASSFDPLTAGDLPIGVAGPDGRAPDGSHVICLDGLSDATRVLRACLPARQASRESAHLSLVGAVAGALLAIAPAVAPGRLPRVLTAIDSAALLAVGNAVRHARLAEGGGDAEPMPAQAADVRTPVPVAALTRRENGEKALA